jgi:hypothetical protein
MGALSLDKSNRHVWTSEHWNVEKSLRNIRGWGYTPTHSCMNLKAKGLQNALL